jgi:hypothetical protein
MHVMPGSLSRRVVGAHAADLQNKYQENVGETVTVFTHRIEHTTDSKAEFSTH